MTDIPATPRLALPLPAVAQAQKEVTHNEALTLLDALVHTVVEAGPIATPPAGAGVGQCWVVDAKPTGEWKGQDNAIAIRTANRWRFASAHVGMRVTRSTDGAQLRFGDNRWQAPGTIGAPMGGSTIDAEARRAIITLILHLTAQGLLIAG